MMSETPLFIPAILGTPRQVSQREYVAKFIIDRIAVRSGIETELIDICNLEIPIDDASESIKNPQFYVGEVTLTPN